MIGHGGGGLAELAEMAGQLVDVAGSIEERVIRVEMEVGKLCCHISMFRTRRVEENKGRN